MYIYIFAEATYPKNVKNMTIVVGTKNFQLIEWIYDISKESKYFEKKMQYLLVGIKVVVNWQQKQIPNSYQTEGQTK